MGLTMQVANAYQQLVRLITLYGNTHVPYRWRVVETASVGFLLGTVDTILYIDTQDWAANPLLAVRSLIVVIVSYGVVTLLLSTFSSWRMVLWLAVGGYTIISGLAWYYKRNPQIDAFRLLFVLLLSLVAAVVTVQLVSLIVGRHQG